MAKLSKEKTQVLQAIGSRLFWALDEKVISIRKRKGKTGGVFDNFTDAQIISIQKVIEEQLRTELESEDYIIFKEKNI